ncbi:MAG: hypothetical protein RIA69_14345 [Cyclobacteriaceae bacterium]
MGRLKSVAIFQQAENCFGGDTETQMPCCEDVHEELKVDDLSPSTFDFKLSPQAYQLVFNVFPIWEDHLYINEKDSHLVIIKSPPPPLLDLNITYQVFRI